MTADFLKSEMGASFTLVMPCVQNLSEKKKQKNKSVTLITNFGILQLNPYGFLFFFLFSSIESKI